METLARICQADQELLLANPFQAVDLTEPADQEKGIQWWEELTAGGGEGMVVKPFEFVTKGRKGLVQPAVKLAGASICGSSMGRPTRRIHAYDVIPGLAERDSSGQAAEAPLPTLPLRPQATNPPTPDRHRTKA